MRKQVDPHAAMIVAPIPARLRADDGQRAGGARPGVSHRPVAEIPAKSAQSTGMKLALTSEPAAPIRSRRAGKESPVNDSATMRRTGRSASPDQARGDAGPGAGPRLRRAAPLLIAAVAVSGTSGSALAVKLFSVLGPVSTLWIRNLLAGLILAVIGCRSFRRPTLGQGLRLAALGLTLAASNLTFYQALGRIPLGVAATLEFAGPLAIAAAGIRRAPDLIWPVLAAAGVTLLGDPTLHVDLAGFALALAAGAFWAIYILLSKRLVHEVGPVMTIGAAFAVSALALTPIAVLAAGPLLHGKVMATALAVAVLSAGLPYLLELVALRTVPASTFSILLSLEPAAAALMGLAILGQHLTPAELLAVLLVVIASAGASWRTGHPGKTAPLATGGHNPAATRHTTARSQAALRSDLRRGSHPPRTLGATGRLWAGDGEPARTNTGRSP
jgi:inner membrane transporter RhtA